LLKILLTWVFSVPSLMNQLGADFFVVLTGAHALENFNLAGAQCVAADAGGLPSDLNRIMPPPDPSNFCDAAAEAADRVFCAVRAFV
jgi:hypothetical protein